MSRLINKLQSYYQCHTKSTTMWTHVVGVPLVIFSLMILLGWVKIFIPGVLELNLAWLAIFVIAIYYILLDLSLGFITTVVLIILCFIASAFNQYGPTITSFYVFAVSFILGCVFQIIGHIIEGQKPALLKKFSQTLIAPLFVVAEILFLFGYRQTLKQHIHKSHQSTEKL